MTVENWYEVEGVEQINTPSLLVFPERIDHNIREMLRISGSPDRLRPHIKTYKMAEVIQMQLKYGIEKFKCATIAEMELLASCSATDILLAMQPVGPDIGRMFDIAESFDSQLFSCLVDNERSAHQLGMEAKRRKKTIGVFLDINNGMNRTGMVPSVQVIKLYKLLTTYDFLVPRGFHVYDGHLRIAEFEDRKKACAAALQPVLNLKSKLEAMGQKVESVVVGGSPTFPAHADQENLVLSPGTVLLWDAGYGSKFQDMNFQYAAVLVTRLISKPKKDRFCLDLGHKALASEMPFPRVQFLNTQDFEQLGQSEEHFVVSAKNPEHYEIGDVFYAVPIHICPTVAKYPQVITVENNKLTGSWKVAARDHKITF